MKSLRIYKTRGRSLTCEVYPSIMTEDGDFSPNDVAPITMTVNPLGAPERRFVVYCKSNVSDAYVLEEIERFCLTLKQMYEL